MLKKYNFVNSCNDLQIRKCVKSCNCKICDEDVKGKDIVYMKSCRLLAQPFHICLDCWEQINGLVKKYKEENDC